MRKIRNDLTNKKFGRLTVIKVDEERSNKRTYWICECECGELKSVRSDSLTTKNPKSSIRSCGCLKKEQNKINLTANHSHKMSGTRLYETWSGMKDRCLNENSRGYLRYGGRGINICQEWLDDFVPFRDWALSNGYSDDLTIDRIDNDGNYEPNNCRWVNDKQQANNRSSNINVEYQNQVFNLKEWKERLDLDMSDTTLYNRYHRGDRGERLFREV